MDSQTQGKHSAQKRFKPPIKRPQEPAPDSHVSGVESSGDPLGNTGSGRRSKRRLIVEEDDEEEEEVEKEVRTPTKQKTSQSTKRTKTLPEESQPSRINGAMSPPSTIPPDTDASQRDKSVPKASPAITKAKAKITEEAVSSVKQTALGKASSSKANGNTARSSGRPSSTRTTPNNSTNTSQETGHTILGDTVGKPSLSRKPSQTILRADTGNKSSSIGKTSGMKAKGEQPKTAGKSIPNKIDNVQNKVGGKPAKEHNGTTVLSGHVQKFNKDDSRLQTPSLAPLDKGKGKCDDLDDEFDSIHQRSRTHLPASSNSGSRRTSGPAPVTTSHNQSTAADIGTFGNVASQTAPGFGNLAKTEAQACEELNIWARRFYFAFLSNTIVDEPVQRVFPGMKPNHKAYKFMKHRVMRLYKNWKTAVIKAAGEFSRRWIEQDANGRNLSDLVTFKDLKRELNRDFKPLWLETVFRFSVNAVDVDQLSDYALRFPKYVFVQLVAGARLVVLQAANPIDLNLLQYTRAWQVKRYDKFCERIEFQDQSVDMYPERTAPYSTRTRLPGDDINNDPDASLGESEDEGDELSDHPEQDPLVGDLDASNSEVGDEDVAEAESEREARIDAEMAAFDERNPIEVSDYQESDSGDNMGYDHTILPAESA